MMLKKSEKELLQQVSEERVVRRCAELVQIPTVNLYSGDKAPSGELSGQLYVEKVLQKLGARTERLECSDTVLAANQVLAPAGRIIRDRPNIIGTVIFGAGTGPTLLLDAHMDTVAVDSYNGNPFSGEVKDGFVWGRGSSDDKGGVAVMLEAVNALCESGAALNGTVVCCSVVEEECDGAGKGTLSCMQHFPRPDAAIVIDGDASAIRNGCCGVVTAEIAVQGQAGHAVSGNSVNAIEKAVALFSAFERFRQIRGNHPGDFNLGFFRGGGHPANVPCEVRLGMNIKTGVQDMKDSSEKYAEYSGRVVRELFEQCVRETAATDAFLVDHPPVVRWVKDVPSAVCPPEPAGLLELAVEAQRDAQDT